MLNYRILTIVQNIGEQEMSCHPVIIFNDTELVLCDAGYPDNTEQINLELMKYGFSIEDITKIVITHQDHDHMGSLNEIKKRNSKIEVISSESEFSYITGEKKSLRLLQAEEYNKTLSGNDLEFGMQFIGYLKSIKSCTVDKTVNDGDYIIQGLKTVSTPGHTPGHISLFLEKDEVLIAGDALAAENNKLVIANPEFTLDLKLCKESIRKIQGLAPKKIICYHGGSIEGNIEEQLNAVLSD